MNLPEGWTEISAEVFLPGKFSGKVEIDWSSFSAPRCESYAKAVSEEPISFNRNANWPFGWNARCRGPEPGLTVTNAGSLGESVAFGPRP